MYPADYKYGKVILIPGLNAFEHGGNIYNAVRNGGLFSNILDFSANINPLGLSESIRQALVENINNVTFYPDAQAHSLKEAISEHYKLNKDLITAGNGAVELLYVLCNILRPRRVLVTAPTFSEYEKAALASGAEIDYLLLDPLNDFAIDPTVVVKSIKEGNTDILFIGNPNNPTGTLLTRIDLELILKAAEEQNTIVVIDESFLDFLMDDHLYTCRYLVPRYSNLVVLHSLTKFYAIPGLRLGFALACPKLTNKLHNGKDPWNVNSLAQCAGVVALKDNEFRRITKRLINKTKDEFYTQLQAVPGFKPYRPAVNFILINIQNTKMDSLELKTKLNQKNLLIRDCSNYPGLSEEYIRLAVKLPEQNQQLITELLKICR